MEPEVAEKDELFNEVTEAKRMLGQIPEEVFEADQVEVKWKKIFKVSKDLMNFLTSCLGQRLASESLSACQQYSLNSVGQCIRGAGLFFVQRSVDRRKKLSSGGYGQGSSSSTCQLRS